MAEHRTVQHCQQQNTTQHIPRQHSTAQHTEHSTTATQTALAVAAGSSKNTAAYTVAHTNTVVAQTSNTTHFFWQQPFLPLFDEFLMFFDEIEKILKNIFKFREEKHAQKHHPNMRRVWLQQMR